MTFIITRINDEEKLGRMYEDYALSLMLPFGEELTDTKETLAKELENFDLKKYRAEQKAKIRRERGMG